MSLLSTERVYVGVAPQQLSGMVVSGRLRRRLVRQRLLPLADRQGMAWEAEIAGIDALLDEEGWSGRDVVVVLSNHYVRHVVVPAERGLSEDELAGLARLVFHDIFGELAGEWELRVSPSRAGQATVASGVPRGLLEQLGAICRSHGRLRSIQPVLMAVFNHIRRAIDTGPVSLALVENGRMTVASLDEGEWLHVASRAGNGNLLPLLLDEENFLQRRATGGTLWLCDLTAGSIAMPADERWNARQVVPPRLSGLEPGKASGLALWGVQ